MQAKREEQLIEHQHARDAAAAARHRDEADAAAKAVTDIQHQMEVRWLCLRSQVLTGNPPFEVCCHVCGDQPRAGGKA